MVSKVVNAIKAVKIHKCFSLLHKLQRGIVGLLWSRRKLWGTVRRVCNAASPPSKRATDEEEQEEKRTLDVRVGRESYRSRGRKGERVVIDNHKLSTGAMQVWDGWPADLASNATFPPSSLAFHSIFGARTFSRRHCF